MQVVFRLRDGCALARSRKNKGSIARGARRWTLDASGGFAREDEARPSDSGSRTDGMVPPVSVAAASLALLFDVSQLAVRSNLAVASDDASTGERGETEKSNETHRLLSVRLEQTMYRGVRSCRPEFFLRKGCVLSTLCSISMNDVFRFSSEYWISVHLLG